MASWWSSTRRSAPLDPIWAAAGHPMAVYRTTFDELLAVSGGRVVDVAERLTQPSISCTVPMRSASSASLSSR